MTETRKKLERSLERLSQKNRPIVPTFQASGTVLERLQKIDLKSLQNHTKRWNDFLERNPKRSHLKGLLFRFGTFHAFSRGPQ